MKSESNGTEASYQLNGALKNDKKNPRRDLHKPPKCFQHLITWMHYLFNILIYYIEPFNYT